MYEYNYLRNKCNKVLNKEGVKDLLGQAVQSKIILAAISRRSMIISLKTLGKKVS